MISHIQGRTQSANFYCLCLSTIPLIDTDVRRTLRDAQLWIDPPELEIVAVAQRTNNAQRPDSQTIQGALLVLSDRLWSQLGRHLRSDLEGQQQHYY